MIMMMYLTIGDSLKYFPHSNSYIHMWFWPLFLFNYNSDNGIRTIL